MTPPEPPRARIPAREVVGCALLGVLLALVLVAELRNGMQLANLGGDTQNIVIGVLLLAAIVAGNVIRGIEAHEFPRLELRRSRREVATGQRAEATTFPNSPKGR